MRFLKHYPSGTGPGVVDPTLPHGEAGILNPDRHEGDTSYRSLCRRGETQQVGVRVRLVPWIV